VYKAAYSLREPIIKLGITDYADYQEIQDKLEAKPEIKTEIEKKVRDYPEEFYELLRILRKNPKLVINKFHSEGENESVVNVGHNPGIINIGDRNPLIVVLVVCFLAFAIVALILFTKQSIVFVNQNVNSSLNPQFDENANGRDSNQNGNQLNKLVTNSTNNIKDNGKTPKNFQQSTGGVSKVKKDTMNPNATPAEETLESSK
jgi:hypothetical protein